jgi:peptidylprolyl isomerase
VPTEKRQRKKEGHQARKAAALAAARRQQRKRRLVTAVAVAVAVLVVMALVSFLSGDDDDETDVAADGTTTTTEAPATTTTTLDITKPEVTVPAEPATELGIEDLVVGEGAEAKLGDTIEVHYVLKKQSDGSEVESSWESSPATFPLEQGGLIDGWIQGIPGMKVGGRRQLVIPESLAYKGEEPSGTLVFVIDLLSIK